MTLSWICFFFLAFRSQTINHKKFLINENPMIEMYGFDFVLDNFNIFMEKYHNGNNYEIYFENKTNGNSYEMDRDYMFYHSNIIIG